MKFEYLTVLVNSEDVPRVLVLKIPAKVAADLEEAGDMADENDAIGAWLDSHYYIDNLQDHEWAISTVQPDVVVNYPLELKS